MEELISKISKGSRMDQIYIPKKRSDFPIGSYVLVKQLETEPKKEFKPFFYNIRYLEPIKVGIIKEIFKSTANADNIIITGSFLDKGFKFNDIDIIMVTEKKQDIAHIKEALERKTGARIHFIKITSKALVKGFSIDPLYRVMLNRCVSKRRVICKPKNEIDYKLLDLHLLKSKTLIDNYDVLTGDQKYEMVRNLIAINRFINKKEVSKTGIDSAIDNAFGHDAVERLKSNTLSKGGFLEKYKKIYNIARNNILEGIKNESKQKQVN